MNSEAPPTANQPDKASVPRHRFQYSVRSLLVFVAVFALLMGISVWFVRWWPLQSRVYRLHHGTYMERVYVAIELANKGPAGVRALLDAVEGEDRDAQMSALVSLAYCTDLRPEAKRAAPVLGRVLAQSSTYPPRDQFAAMALARLGPAAADAAPQLAEALEWNWHRYPGNEAAFYVILALARIGPGARDTTAALVAFQERDGYRTCINGKLSEGSLGLGMWVDCALTRIDPEGHPPKALIAPLVERLTTDRWYPGRSETRNTTILALAEMGPVAKDAVPALRALLQDPEFANESCRWGAATLEEDHQGSGKDCVLWALGRIDPQSVPDGSQGDL